MKTWIVLLRGNQKLVKFTSREHRLTVDDRGICFVVKTRYIGEGMNYQSVFYPFSGIDSLVTEGDDKDETVQE